MLLGAPGVSSAVPVEAETGSLGCPPAVAPQLHLITHTMLLGAFEVPAVVPVKVWPSSLGVNVMCARHA